MNQVEFDKLVAETIDSIQQLLTVKGGEYAGSEDRLANFKRGAELTGVTPLQVAMIYLSKHYDAVSTYVRDTAQGVSRPRSESILGRLDDIINYGILLKGLVLEQQEAEKLGSAAMKEFATMPAFTPPDDIVAYTILEGSGWIAAEHPATYEHWRMRKARIEQGSKQIFLSEIEKWVHAWKLSDGTTYDAVNGKR